jgi:hypothetical protein
MAQGIGGEVIGEIVTGQGGEQADGGMWRSAWSSVAKESDSVYQPGKEAGMNNEHERTMREPVRERRLLKGCVGLPGKPHGPVRLVFYVALILVTAGVFGGALLNVWIDEQNAFLPLFLICLSILIAHDAYGNRLLPPPNGLAQLTGYLQAVWCFALGAILLWKYTSS